MLRDGLNVVLAGEPNVGKSSLLNALAGAEVAIVTPIAGTTRDRVTQAIQIEGVPLNIIDTAGLRDTHDEVERLGIERTWAAIADADVVVLLSNASGDDRPPPLPQALLDRLPDGVPMVRVHNKIDLLEGAVPRVDTAERAVWLSARTGAGVDLLRRVLLELAGWQPGNESQFIARERHLAALRSAQSHLATAATFAGLGNAHLDLFAEELRLAQVALGTITGEFTADDLLGVIFARFCIGK